MLLSYDWPFGCAIGIVLPEISSVWINIIELIPVIPVHTVQTRVTAKCVTACYRCKALDRYYDIAR